MLITVLLYSVNLYAYPGGITGRTLKTSTTGCGGGCHNVSTAITGLITGPSVVTTGQTYTYTLTINMASGSGKLGLNIAVKNGTLGIGTSGLLKLASGELTHTAAITYSNPKIITFSYTAPNVSGTDTLYATVDRGYSGAWAFTPNLGFTVQATSGIINNSTPVSFGLEQNFPNPFNPSTQINYNIEKKGLVTLKVYNALGKEVVTLVNENQEPGRYYAIFNAENISSGMYYYKLESDGKSEMKKMIMIK